MNRCAAKVIRISWYS